MNNIPRYTVEFIITIHCFFRSNVLIRSVRFALSFTSELIASKRLSNNEYLKEKQAFEFISALLIQQRVIFPGRVFFKCLEYIFEIMVDPNVSMVNSKTVQTKLNETLSQFVIFIGTVIYIKWYRWPFISQPDWVNLRTWFLFFHQNIEHEIVESVNPEHGQKTAWNAFVLKKVGIFLRAIAPVLIPPVGFIQQDLIWCYGYDRYKEPWRLKFCNSSRHFWVLVVNGSVFM